MSTNFNEFFAEVIRRQREPLCEEQIETLQSWFFPGFYDENPNKQMQESTKEMMGAYSRWEAEQVKREKELEAKKPLPPMSDAELDELAEMF